MKNTNLKKVLAIVLSLAMMLSVCTMGFTANAEDAVDLSYYVINDTTMKAWRNDNQSMALASYEGNTVYRISPQAKSTGQFNFASKADLSDYSTVNSLSYYLANDTGTDLQIRYQYYANDGADVAFFNGYVYLMDGATGEMLPVLAKTGYFTVPAGFKGYVIYDLSQSDRYGNARIKNGTDENGETIWDTSKTTVDLVKEELFKKLSVFAQYTDAMVGKAWYIGDLAVSTQTVEELAKSLSGAKVIAYNFNMASIRRMDADENIMFWGTKFDNDGTADNNAFPTIVDYGTLEGKGSQFTNVDAAAGNVSSVIIRDSFWATNGTDLPFAIEKAKALKIDIKMTGDIGFHPCVNGEPNKINGIYYYVSNSGIVTTSETCNPPADFEGSLYVVFNEENGVGANYNTVNSSWETFVSAIEGSFGMTIYSSHGTVGDTITFGGFSFIYDTTDFEANITPEVIAKTNPVLFDGTTLPMKWSGDGDLSTSQVGDWDINIVDGKYVASRIADSTDGLANCLYLNDRGLSQALPGDIDVNAITGFSFEFKVPDDGNTHTLKICLEYVNAGTYCGGITAINKDGTIAATRNYAWNGAAITLPAGFDGIIVMRDDTSYNRSYYNGYYYNGTGHVTFADYYAARGNVFKGISLFVGTSGTYEIGVSEYVYDNFRALTEDFNTYIANVQSDYVAAIKVEAEKVANTDGGYIVNDFSGVNNNTLSISNVGVSNVVDTSYVTDEDGTAYAGQIKFSTSPASGQRRLTFNTNTGDLDVSKVVGFTYKINVTNPGNFAVNSGHQVNGQANAITNPTVYIINDETGEITKGTEFTNNSTFKGTVVVLFGEDVAVTGGYADSSSDPTYTWSEFVAAKGSITDIGLWLSDRAVSEKIYAEDGTTVTSVVLTEACANFAMEIDDLAFVYSENPIVKEIAARYDTEKYFVPINDLTRTTFTEYNSFTNHTGRYSGYTHTAPFTPTIDSSVNNPAGVAYKFTRVETTDLTTREFKIKNRSTLTKDELKEKEAIAYWVKVPEGETLGLSKVLGGESDVVYTSVMTYDVVTGETQLIAGGADLILSGFEGYVIIPLQNALIGKPGTAYGELTGPISYDDFIDAKGISQLYFYMAGGAYKNITTAFWMGEFQFVDSISDFFAEIGAETVAGDANGDLVVDIRDLVRLKKFNADAKTAIAYQNADIDNNGLIDTAADLIASRKQMVDVDFTVEKEASLVEYPDVFVGFYHGDYGTWDYYASDIAAESDVLNTYTGLDMYTLAQLKENGGASWFYLSRSRDGEPVFGTKDGGYDSAATELNDAWKAALDADIQQIKDAKLWNQVAGFHTEEILSNGTMTQAQYAAMTQYLRETYGKRILAVLSVSEVNAATPEAYANVTDIGYDRYGTDKETLTTEITALKTNIGDRTDIKYWVLPTAYCGKNDDGTPSRTDESLAAEINMFAEVFADTTLIPEDQRGGILFYTFRTFYDGGYDYVVSAGNSGSFGLDLLLRDYDYTLTAQAIADMAAKYVD